MNYNIAKHLLGKTRFTVKTTSDPDPDPDPYQNEMDPQH